MDSVYPRDEKLDEREKKGITRREPTSLVHLSNEKLDERRS